MLHLETFSEVRRRTLLEEADRERLARQARGGNSHGERERAGRLWPIFRLPALPKRPRERAPGVI